VGDGVFLMRKAINELLESCSLQRLYCCFGLYAVVIVFYNGGDRRKSSDPILHY